MGRLPTKNCVNMHDIIGQPLGALSDAVDAVLRRPEPLDDLEISSIFHESSFLLLRAEEALAAREEDAFAALFRLMSEGLSRNEASYEEGIKTFALDGQLLQTIHSLFTSVVENGGLPLHSTGVTEITQVVSSLCDGEAIRDSCGSVFLSTLLSIFEQIRTNADAAAHHFHVQRAAATALINLVKGSKANKQRLSQVALIGECCVASVDVFFQLQCVELLFRLSRQKKGLLDSLEVVMPGKTVQHLRDLPNDSTLLPRMAAAVEAMNANRADVLHFKLGPIAAGETVLTEVTDAFFTPHFMTIMITTSNADNITIPYCIIRSVTLGKDGRILVRLEEFPVKLEALLSHTPGMDTVTLHMTASRLNAFKQSSVKQWIVAALQIRTREQRIQAVKVGATDVIGTKRRSCPVDATGPEPDGDANSTLEVVNAAAAEGKRWTRTPERHPISPGKSIATTDQRAKRSAPAPEAQQFAQLLKQRIDADAEDRRGNGTAELNRIMAAIQSTVDSARQRADSHRRGFQQQLGSEIDHLEQHIHQTQEYASSAVNQLNGNLGSVKCSNTALNERIACLEMGLQQLLEESRLAEARQLREVATQCSYNDCVDAMAGEKAGTMQYRSAPLQKLHAF